MVPSLPMIKWLSLAGSLPLLTPLIHPSNISITGTGSNYQIKTRNSGDPDTKPPLIIRSLASLIINYIACFQPKNQSIFSIYLTNSKDFWTPIRCQMFALNTFLRVSKSAKLSAKHSPNWLLMEPSCLVESNIITIFAFVFTNPQNCIKPQLYFYFLSATRLNSE